MAGIYLHIPFCKQACHYCDFHFSTDLEIRTELVHAMGDEIALQQQYLNGEPVDTIYFGGGTPSLLSGDEIAFLLEKLRRNHAIAATAEITLEANPDDLLPDKLVELKSVGINRLSIGIQSFDDSILRYLNRAHDSNAATRCMEYARHAGFANISIDLIYAIPGLSAEAWIYNIDRALQFRPEHLSAYTLTIEEKTTFGNWMSKGKLVPVDESTAAEQMEILVTALSKNGYRQYEISNFGLPGFESKHNSNYWKGGKYLGIGPSAHSYDQSTRQHNIANNHLYVQSLKEKDVPAETEVLKKEDQINEYILTTLRTDAGCNLTILKNGFGYDVLALHSRYLRELQDHKLVSLEDHYLKLTAAGKLLADKISSDLFLIE
jgi:oxygen-independent coproporphyrinogen-3 oxidase